MLSPASRLLALLMLVVLGLLVACTSDDGARTREDTSPLYVAIGASDSVGTGARNPGTDGWVPQLHAKMPKDTRLANLGIGGLKMHEALEQVLPVAVDLHPTTVTIWLSVNDLVSGVSLEQYQADLHTMLATLAQETDARVHVANVPDLTLLPVFRGRQIPGLSEMIAQWNEMIAATVAANGAILVDLFAGWSELRTRPDYVSRDGFHPSTQGHKRLAEIFWTVMKAEAHLTPRLPSLHGKGEMGGTRPATVMALQRPLLRCAISSQLVYGPLPLSSQGRGSGGGVNRATNPSPRNVSLASAPVPSHG